MQKIKFISALLIFIAIIPLYSQSNSECFMILAGRNASYDGSVLTAHNNDLTGEEASLIEIIERKHHDADETIPFPSGLEIPQVPVTYRWMVLRIYKGFAEGDAAAINEHQVSIAGGVALGSDRNETARQIDPLIETGLTGGVRYIALQRAQTARECVEILGQLYSTYGITYPSGVGISDTSECWYIEAAGGHHWAAVRVPDDQYMVIANGYRIGTIDPSDSANVILSPGLTELLLENELWKKDQPLNFAAIFGGGRANRYYDTRRVWRGISLLSPSIDPHPDSLHFPMFCKPDEKLTLQKLFSLLRDRYEGTPYCPDITSDSLNERVICIDRAVHSDVIQLRGWMPAEAGAVLWAATGVAAVTPFVPFYSGIDSVPHEYTIAGKGPSDSSAFWLFRGLADLVLPVYGYIGSYVTTELRKLENGFIEEQLSIEIAASFKNEANSNKLPQYLTGKTFLFSQKALELRQRLYKTLSK